MTSTIKENFTNNIMFLEIYKNYMHFYDINQVKFLGFAIDVVTSEKVFTIRSIKCNYKYLSRI
jgi:hypothetical protein